MGESIVIIGASAAGFSAAKEIRQQNPAVAVTLISEERRPPYYRPMLTEYISDSSVENKSAFSLGQVSWFAENAIDFRMGERAVAIDIPARTVTTDLGRVYPFTKLILAFGSVPFVPFADALKRRNVFAVRTYEDARSVYEYAGGVKSAIVIGGGLLGLEAASSLQKRGLDVSIIELSERILPRQLDAESSSFLEKIILSAGAKLHLGAQIQAILGEDVATGVKLAGGEEVNADMIVFSIGVRPNTDLAKSCGIEVNRAVVVNSMMETSVPGIFACGDIAEFNGRTPALWMPAVRQGRVAGANASGGRDEFKDEVYPAVLNSFGTKIFSTGDFCQEVAPPALKVIRSEDGTGKNLIKLFFVNGVFTGMILIGDISRSQKLLQALKKGMSHDEVAAML